MLRCGFTFQTKLFIGVLVSAQSLLAQATTGQIEGRIIDQSGAAVPQAKVTLTNADTAQTREATSNEQGNYAVPLLPPGNYGLKVFKPGFKVLVQSGITLAVDQFARLDMTLELGSVSDSVQVVGRLRCSMRTLPRSAR